MSSVLNLVLISLTISQSAIAKAIRKDVASWPTSHAVDLFEIIAFRGDADLRTSIRVGDIQIRADLTFSHPYLWLPMYGCIFESTEYDDICHDRSETYALKGEEKQRPIDCAQILGPHSYILGLKWSAYMSLSKSRRSEEPSPPKIPFILATVLHEVERGGIGLSPQSVFANHTLRWLRNGNRAKSSLPAPFFTVAQVPNVLGVTFENINEGLCKLPKNSQDRIFLDLADNRSRHWLVAFRELRVWNLRMQGNMMALINFDSPYITLPSSLIDLIHINNPEKIRVDDQGRVFVRRNIELSIGISTPEWEFTLDEGTYRRGPMGNEEYEELLIRRGDMDPSTIWLGGPFIESFCVLCEMPKMDPRGSPWTEARARVGILKRKTGGGIISPARKDGCVDKNALLPTTTATLNSTETPCSKVRIFDVEKM